MPTFRLRRISKLDSLKAMRPDILRLFLKPHAQYFQGRGLSLDADAPLDHETLAAILMTLGDDVPSALADDLYVVDEMATSDGMDALLGDLASQDRERIGVEGEVTPADVAMLVRLHEPNLLERKHGEQCVTAKRSFSSFQSSLQPRSRKPPKGERLRALEGQLGSGLEGLNRGSEARVLFFVEGDRMAILVRRGDPYRREGAIGGNGSPSSVYYRPECIDVLWFDPDLSVLQINASGKKIQQLYLAAFGTALFDDAEAFESAKRYTLEPLRTDGSASAVCTDIEGLDWVRLREIQYYWGGRHKEVEIRKATDLFAVIEARRTKIPSRPLLRSAKFQVKFTDAKSPRMLSIRPPAEASYARDSDADVLEEWLRVRGFKNEGAAR